MLNADYQISVIVPAYNAEKTIRRAVESVLSQSLRPLEILVIDDGSTDDTAAVVRDCDPCVRLFSQPNSGPAAARNHGLREAKGNWVAFLDADDSWTPDKLSVQVAYLKQHPEIGFLHTDVMFFDADTDQQWQTNVGREKFIGHCTEVLLLENRILASSVLVSRKFLEDAGEFDEQFKGVEDYDLWLRLSRVCKFAYLPSPVVHYQVHFGSLSSQSLSMRKGELQVVEKMLQVISASDNGPLKSFVGSHQLRDRLAQLSWDVGSQAFEEGDYAQARPYLRRSLSLGPWNIRKFYLWLSTLLPNSMTSRLRHWKQRANRSSGQVMA